MHYLLHTSVLAKSACASNFSRKTFTTAIHSRGFPPVCRLLSCCCQHLTPHTGHRQPCMHSVSEVKGKKGRRKRMKKDGEEMSGRNQESERTEQDKVEDSKERGSGAESIIYR